MKKREILKFCLFALIVIFVGVNRINAATVTTATPIDCDGSSCAAADKKLDNKQAYCITNDRGWPAEGSIYTEKNNVILEKNILFALEVGKSEHTTMALKESALHTLNLKTDNEIKNLCNANNDCKASKEIINNGLTSKTGTLQFNKIGSNYVAEVSLVGYNLNNYNTCTVNKGSSTIKSQNTTNLKTTVTFEITIPESSVDETTITFTCPQAYQKYYKSTTYTCSNSADARPCSELQDLTVPEEGQKQLNVNISGKITKKSKVTISKSDATGQKELPGATLSILGSDNKVLNKCVFDKTNHKITYSDGADAKACTWVSEDVSYDIEGLPTGKYYLVEDIAPEGYEKSSEKIEIEITDAGAVKDKVVMINSPKKVPVPDTLSTKSAILLTISMIDVALGIGLLLYIKKNKILN